MSTAVENPRKRYPRAAALAVVRALLAELGPACERVVVAGSLRRRKAEVGDIELLYIARTVRVPDPEDFFGATIAANAVDLALAAMLEEGTLARRPSVRGQGAWGRQNKFAVHVASGIPVDLFASDAERWWNMLVCRTGGAATNQRIAEEARLWGWQWNPYAEGFSRPAPGRPGEREVHRVRSEADVFHRAGLPFQEPEARE